MRDDAVPVVPVTVEDLDELEELNPADRLLRVDGEVLILREIPHHEFYAAAALGGRIQDMMMTGEFAVGEVEKTNIRLAMMLYGQANPWLAERDEQAFQAAHDAWKKLPEPASPADPRLRIADDEKPPEPKREQFYGVWFGRVTPRKLAYLTVEAIKLGTVIFGADEVEEQGEGGGLSNVPPALAAATKAARQRGRLSGNGGTRTRR